MSSRGRRTFTRRTPTRVTTTRPTTTTKKKTTKKRAKRPSTKTVKQVATKTKVVVPVVQRQTTAKRTATKTVGGRGAVGEVKRTQQIVRQKEARAKRVSTTGTASVKREAERQVAKARRDAEKRAEAQKVAREAERLKKSADPELAKLAREGRVGRAQQREEQKRQVAVQQQAIRQDTAERQERARARGFQGGFESAEAQQSAVQNIIASIREPIPQASAFQDRGRQQRNISEISGTPPAFAGSLTSLFGGFGTQERQTQAQELARQRALERFPDPVGPVEQVDRGVQIGGPSFIGGTTVSPRQETFTRPELAREAPRQEFVSPTGAVLRPDSKEARRQVLLQQRGGAPVQVSVGSLALQRIQEGQVLGRGEDVGVTGLERDVTLAQRQEQDVFRAINVAQSDRFRAISGAQSGIEALQIARASPELSVFPAFGRGAGVTGVQFRDEFGTVRGTAGPVPVAGVDFGLEADSTRGLFQTPEGRQQIRQQLDESGRFSLAQAVGFEDAPRPTGELFVQTDVPLGRAQTRELVPLQRGDRTVFVTPETRERIIARETTPATRAVLGGEVATLFGNQQVQAIDAPSTRASSQRQVVLPSGEIQLVTTQTVDGRPVGTITQQVSPPTEFQGALPPAFAGSIGAGEQDFRPKAGEPQGLERIGLGFVQSLENELAGLQNIGSLATGGQIPEREFNVTPSEQIFGGAIRGAIGQATGEGNFVESVQRGVSGATRQAQQDPFLTIGDVGAQALLFLPVGAVKAGSAIARVGGQVGKTLTRTTRARQATEGRQIAGGSATIFAPPTQIAQTPRRALELGFTAEDAGLVARSRRSPTARFDPLEAIDPTTREFTRVTTQRAFREVPQTREFLSRGTGVARIESAVPTDVTRVFPRGAEIGAVRRTGLRSTPEVTSLERVTTPTIIGAPRQGAFRSTVVRRGRGSGELIPIDQAVTRTEDIFTPFATTQRAQRTTTRATKTTKKTRKADDVRRSDDPLEAVTGGGLQLQTVVRPTTRATAKAKKGAKKATDEITDPQFGQRLPEGGGRGSLPRLGGRGGTGARRGTSSFGAGPALLGITGISATGVAIAQDDRVNVDSIFRGDAVGIRTREGIRQRQGQRIRGRQTTPTPEARTPRIGTTFDQPEQPVFRQTGVPDEPFRQVGRAGGPVPFQFLGEEEAGQSGRRQRRFFRVFDVAQTPFGRVERGLGVQVQSDVPIFEVAEVAGRAPQQNVTERFFDGQNGRRNGNRRSNIADELFSL